MAAASTQPTGARIELTVPARAQYLYLVRLHVGAVAARLDMTLEVIEDLHLAAEELCMSLLSLSRGTPDHLTVGITWDDDALEIACRLEGPPHDGGPWTNEGFPELLSRRILDALADEHSVDTDADPPSAWLRKRRGDSRTSR